MTLSLFQAHQQHPSSASSHSHKSSDSKLEHGMNSKRKWENNNLKQMLWIFKIGTDHSAVHISTTVSPNKAHHNDSFPSVQHNSSVVSTTQHHHENNITTKPSTASTPKVVVTITAQPQQQQFHAAAFKSSADCLMSFFAETLLVAFFTAAVL